MGDFIEEDFSGSRFSSRWAEFDREGNIWAWQDDIKLYLVTSTYTQLHHPSIRYLSNRSGQRIQSQTPEQKKSYRLR